MSSTEESALLDGLTRHGGDLVDVSNADGGLHVAVLLREALDDRTVSARMAGRRLVATPLSGCCVGASTRTGLLLGFGTSTPERLIEATRRLEEVLRETMAESVRRGDATKGSTARRRIDTLRAAP